jgi:hypothetical protein
VRHWTPKSLDRHWIGRGEEGSGVSLSWQLVKGGAERRKAWDDVVASCGYATFFHTRAWAELFATTLGTWAPDPVVFEFSDGNVAVLPLMRRLDSEHRESTVPGMYGGPLFSRPPSEDHLDGFEAHLWYKDIFILDSPFTPYRWDPDGLVKWRFHTHIADLSGGFDEAWSRYRTNVKRNIRKAEAAGVEIHAGTSTADLQAYYEVYEDSLRRFGDDLRSFYPARLFENLRAIPGFGRDVQLSLASVDGRVVSGLVMLRWANTAIAWHYSTRPGDLGSHACPLLLRDAMQRACAEGFRWFDFLVSGSLKGVAHFKEGFGTRRTRYNAYWSPGMTPASSRPDTGTGAAPEKIQQLRRKGGPDPA